MATIEGHFLPMVHIGGHFLPMGHIGGHILPMIPFGAIFFPWSKIHYWGNSISSTFTISNGIRQGGIISPFLFNVYIIIWGLFTEKSHSIVQNADLYNMAICLTILLNSYELNNKNYLTKTIYNQKQWDRGHSLSIIQHSYKIWYRRMTITFGVALHDGKVIPITGIPSVNLSQLGR